MNSTNLLYLSIDIASKVSRFEATCNNIALILGESIAVAKYASGV